MQWVAQGGKLILSQLFYKLKALTQPLGLWLMSVWAGLYLSEPFEDLAIYVN
jgi:hypothetical protein